MSLNRPVVVFDVNETLLDLSALGPSFSNVLPVELMPLWFARMLFSSAVSSMSGSYATFDVHGVDALIATAVTAGMEISQEEATDVVEGMRSLPPHPDVIPALSSLVEGGARLMTLTNSSSKVVTDQISNAGLGQFFERLLSVDGVGVFKPAPEVYEYAAAEAGVAIHEICLVAAHAWDVTGAIRAGASAAFVARAGARLGITSETPEIVGKDLLEVAAALVA